MSNINLNVDVGQTKTLTFNTKDKYNTEDIVFNIAATDTLADWAKAATKPSYTWSEITGKPTFATVATSGSYNDLSDKPSLNYLPLAGGTMTGAIDMNKNPLNNAGFEVVTALPTTNLFVGRKVVMKGIEYTYNGVKFIANGINTIDKSMINRNLTTLTPDEISYNDIIYNDPYIYASNFNSTLESFTPEVVETYTDNSWQTISFPTNHITSSNTPIRFTMFKNRVSSRSLGYISSIFMWTRNWGYDMHIKIEYQSYNTDTQTFDWFIVKELDCKDSSCIIPLPGKTLYPSEADDNNKGTYYVDNARITISFLNSNAQIALRGLKFNTAGIIPLTDVKFDINYDAIIKPTQTGNTVTKTNNWVLQYLTQGVHWLRDNKVETNSDATLSTLNIKGKANSTATITADHSNNLYVTIGGNIPFGVFPTEVCPGVQNSNQISLGVQSQYWKEVWAGKYIVPNGTSSQFLKADGSVDSNSYATLDGTGKIPTSQLPSYVDDVVEYVNSDAFPETGESGKIYMDASSGDIYRWTGSQYLKISGIIGAQGEKGEQGIQGFQGFQGIQGPAGSGGGGIHFRENTGYSVDTTGAAITETSTFFSGNSTYILVGATDLGTNESTILDKAASRGTIFAGSRNIIIDLKNISGLTGTKNLWIFPELRSRLLGLGVTPGVRYTIYIVNFSSYNNRGGGVLRIPIVSGFSSYSHNGVSEDVLGYLGGAYQEGGDGLYLSQYGESAKIEFIINDQNFRSTDSVRVDISFDHMGEIGNRGGSGVNYVNTNPAYSPAAPSDDGRSNINLIDDSSLQTISNFLTSNSGILPKSVITDKSTGTYKIATPDLIAMLIQVLVDKKVITLK